MCLNYLVFQLRPQVGRATEFGPKTKTKLAQTLTNRTIWPHCGRVNHLELRFASVDVLDDFRVDLFLRTPEVQLVDESPSGP